MQAVSTDGAYQQLVALLASLRCTREKVRFLLLAANMALVACCASQMRVLVTPVVQLPVWERRSVHAVRTDGARQQLVACLARLRRTAEKVRFFPLTANMALVASCASQMCVPLALVVQLRLWE